ncbi:hypothetical protein OIU79_024018, partial [Salix purpurea]
MLPDWSIPCSTFNSNHVKPYDHVNMSPIKFSGLVRTGRLIHPYFLLQQQKIDHDDQRWSQWLDAFEFLCWNYRIYIVHLSHVCLYFYDTDFEPLRFTCFVTWSVLSCIKGNK